MESIPRFRRFAECQECNTLLDACLTFADASFKEKFLGTGIFRALWVCFISESRNALWSSREKPLFCSLRFSSNRTCLEFYVNNAKTFYFAKGETLSRYTFLLKAPNLSPNITFQKLPNNAPINSKHPIPRHLNFWRLANSNSRPGANRKSRACRYCLRER